MIWHICFVSLPHLFEIQLFSSHIDHPMSRQQTFLSWTDDTHDRLIIEPNTSSIYIDRCYRKVEHLIATCLLTNHQIYECHPAQQQKRIKRETGDKSKRSSYVFLLLIIGIPCCFIVGIIAGITITIYVSMKRQQRREQQSQRYMANKRFDPVIKSLSINNETSTRLKQNKIPSKSTIFSSTSDHSSIRREREIPDNASFTLNRHKLLQDLSSKREQPIQRPPVSNLSDMKSAATLGNMSGNLARTKIPSNQQYKK